MKVLLINGSPHPSGNTYKALLEITTTLNKNGVDSEIVWIGNKAIHGCIACNRCRTTGICVFRENPYGEIREKLKTSDGIIIGSPVYFAGPNGSLCALLDRIFYSCRPDLYYKPAASISVCRRAGACTTFDRLNKYFTLLNMPVVSSQYWNLAFGATPGEVEQDAEGMQTMRTLGLNMAWLLHKIHKDTPDYPQPEDKIATNFIR